MLSSHEFAEALLALRDDDDGPDAAAALQIVAETVLLHRLWLRRELKPADE